jgi:cell wall-associated NlpC family hydrolase
VRPEHRRLSAILAGIATASLVLVAVGGAPAQADTPQQRATALAAKVADLRQQAAIAAEAYDDVEGQLGLVVTEASLAQERADDAKKDVSAAAASNDARARALYMLGGSGPLYAQVFNPAGGALELHTNLIATRNILRSADEAAKEAVATSNSADTAAADATRLSALQAHLEAQASTHAADIQKALDATQQALDSANTEVRQLELIAEQQAQEASNLAFTQTLSAADLAALAQTGPASSPAAAAALEFAKSQQGKPYRYAGTGPNTYDCSGLTGAAYASVGIGLPRTAAQQYLSGPHVALADLKPGDLLFWGTNPSRPSSIFHTAIYAGSGFMVSANHTGDVVRLQKVWWSQYFGATRPNAAAAAAVGGPRWVGGQYQ